MDDSEVALKGLMLRGLDGDAQAYRRLLALLSERLRLYFTRRLGEARDDVEDLVQETLLAAHTRRATYDRTQPLTPWVYALGRYKLIDHWRRRRVRAHLPIEDYADFLAADSHDPTAAGDLDRVMSGLSAQHQTLVRDVKIEGLSLAEAGERAKMSEGAAKVALHRAMKRLAEKARGRAD